MLGRYLKDESSLNASCLGVCCISYLLESYFRNDDSGGQLFVELAVSALRQDQSCD